MGRKKQYRQQIAQHVNSLHAKSLLDCLIFETHAQFVPEKAMAEIVANKAYSTLIHNQHNRPDESIVLPLIAGRNFHQRIDFESAKKQEVQLIPCPFDDIEVFERGGLKSLQNARICRLIEEAYFQNALFNSSTLACLLNMGNRNVRERLKYLWSKGLRLPLCGINRKHRDSMNQFRSTMAMQRFLKGERIESIIEDLFLTKRSFRYLQLELVKTAQLSDKKPEEIMNIIGCDQEKVMEYLCILEDGKESSPFRQIESEMAYRRPPQGQDWRAFVEDLEFNHNWSSAKINAYLEFLEGFFQDEASNRPSNMILYHALSDKEPSGKPLSECRKVPVWIPFYTQDDFSNFNGYTTSSLKWNRILRYTTSVKSQGALLNQADLVFLLGVHSSVISRLMQKNLKVFVPTRGNYVDIGPGLTHVEKIIELYLQGFTETQIKKQTKHSYKSIENYIYNFSILVGLWERGLPLPLIRQVMGKSMALVQKYKDLYDKFNREEYSFIFLHLRKLFETQELKKKHM